MSKKHTLEYVKQYFEDHGCELLEIEYKNNYTKIRYICNCKNISKISFNSFKQGTRCSECSKTKKLTIEYVKKYFKDHNCELLEKIYKNTDSPMMYKCSCGNISKINFYNFVKYV